MSVAIGVYLWGLFVCWIAGFAAGVSKRYGANRYRAFVIFWPVLLPAYCVYLLLEAS